MTPKARLKRHWFQWHWRTLHGAVLGLLSCAFVQAYSQNLIPNPGFEDHAPCMEGGLGLTLLDDWDVVPCAGGLDYFNVCNTVNGVPERGVPENMYGQEPAHGGEGYGGVCTYDYYAPQHHNPREFWYVELSQSLTAGQQYCFSMWASRADTACYETSPLHCLLLQDEPPNLCEAPDTVWYAQAQIQLNTTAVGADGWSLVQGSFIAQGGENNITIGELLTDDEVDTLVVGTLHNPRIAYYYIDDLYLGTCDVGMPAESVDKLRLYPTLVEAGGSVTVELARPPLGAVCTVQVIDQAGSIVLVTTMTQQTEIIALTGMASGAYHLRVSTADIFYCAPLFIK